jgi:hypothetical protein
MAGDSVQVKEYCTVRLASEQLYVPILKWYRALCLHLQEECNVFSDDIQNRHLNVLVSWMLARKSHVYSEQDSDTATTVASYKLGSVLPELSQ